MTILDYLQATGFTPNDDLDRAELSIFDNGRTRVCYDDAEEAWSLIQFTGRPGHSPCDWQISFPNVPHEVIRAAIHAAITGA